MEIFKQVFGKYEVSNYGNVRNSNTNTMLKPIKDRYGYLIVCLFEDGKRFYKKIHRLVATAFIENPENKPCIDHVDGQRENNVCTNLRWVTPKENTHNPSTMRKIKENCKPPKPKTKAVYCEETNKTYISAKEAYKQTHIDSSCITKCCKGKRRIAGGLHWKYAE